jgi:hypothetical protein
MRSALATGQVPKVGATELASAGRNPLLEPGRHEIEDQVAEDDQVVTRLTAHGVHQRDLPGSRHRPPGHDDRNRDLPHRNGKIAEKWPDKDALGFL